MSIYNKKESVVLLVGDITFFAMSLWLALFLRYLSLPGVDVFFEHIAPFSILFLSWVMIFYIFGLYGKHTLFFKTRLPLLLLNAQLLNALLATLFFYFIPIFNIAPKTILALAIAVSFFFILLWRTKIVPLLGFRRRERAILIGSGADKELLLKEVCGNHRRYAFSFVSSVDLDKIASVNFEEDILNKVHAERVSVIVLDFNSGKLSPFLQHFYNLLFDGVRFIDINTMYEEIFDRVPVSSLHQSWVLKNISASSRISYDLLKRIMDVIVSLLLGLCSVAILPLVYIAIRFEDGGPVFIKQVRVGKGNCLIAIYKLRTMNIISESGENASERHITRVGNFLRKTRIDELPQLWNVLKGDMSLIGPRQELPHLAKLYEEKIPYYNVRHLIKPGLSGWAQIHMEKPPKFGVGYNETEEKLSYDLFYIKHRSFLLDVKISLFTIKTLLSRSGV